MGDWIYVLTAKGRLARTSGASGVPPQLRRSLALIDGRRSRDEILSIIGRSAVNAGGLSLFVTGGYIERAPTEALAPPSDSITASTSKPSKKPVLEDSSVAAVAPKKKRAADASTAQSSSGPSAKPVTARSSERPPEGKAKRPSTQGNSGGVDARPAKPTAIRVSSTPAPVAPAAKFPVPGSATSPGAVVSVAPELNRTQPALQAGKTRGGGHSRGALLSMHGYLATYMVETIGRWLDDDEGDKHLYRIEQAESMAELLPLIEPLIDAILDVAGPEAAADFADGAASILEPRTTR